MAINFEARGAIARPKWLLAQLLAGCATWQRLTASLDADEAADRIYAAEADDRTDENGRSANPRPRAIVASGRKWEAKAISVGGFENRGELALSIEASYDDFCGMFAANLWHAEHWPQQLWPEVAVSRGRQDMAFESKVGEVLDQMLARSGQQPEAGDIANDEPQALLAVDMVTEFLAPGPCPCAVDDPTGRQFGGCVYLIGWR